MQNIKYHYECLGCHKPLNTYKLHPYGWICLKCRPKVKLIVKCSVCGCDVPIQWETYSLKDPSIPWRCRSCNDKYRNALYEAKPEEEKKAFVESQRERSKAYWSSLDDKTKEADSKRRKDLWKKRKEDGSGQLILDAMKEGRANWWNSLSDEEKLTQWGYMEAGRAKWWNSLTNEEKEEHMKHPHEGFTRWFNSLSTQEQKAFLAPVLKGNKEFWDNMTDEGFKTWLGSLKEGVLRHFISMGKNDGLSNNEVAMRDMLKKHGLKFDIRWINSIKHPNFDILFPVNTATGSTNISPYHEWDFIVHTLDRDILIDVDGSVHDPKNKTTGVTEFNDSKRPYQTDGLLAFKVLCYNDKLSDDTPVMSIDESDKRETMSLSNLLALMEWYNLSKSEKKQALK